MVEILLHLRVVGGVRLLVLDLLLLHFVAEGMLMALERWEGGGGDMNVFFC